MYATENGISTQNRVDAACSMPLTNSIEATANQVRLLMDVIDALAGRLTLVLGEERVSPTVPQSAASAPTRETLVTRVDCIGRSIAQAERRIADIAERLLL